MCGTCGGNKNAQGGAVNGKLIESSQAQQISGQADQVKDNYCIEEYRAQQQPYAERVPCIGDYEQHLFETPNEDICDKGPRNPYHIPGYAGHVPTLQSRSGGTYGHDTHEVLDSTGHTSSLHARGGHICPAPLHEPYRLPGYTGHVPGLKSMVGGTYGQDTHKLLYTVENYPTRQENLSPYRLSQANNCGNEGNGGKSSDTKQNGHSYNGEQPSYMSQNGHSGNGEQYPVSKPNGQPHNQPFQNKPAQGETTATYQKPKEHYYQPQYKYRIADTYATRADLTLVDPCVNEESKVIISTRELDDTQVVRTQDCLEERVEDFPFINRPIRHRPVVPGFDTFIDAMRGARGQRFEFSASSPSHMQLQQQLILQKGKIMDPSHGENCDEKKNGKNYQGHNQAACDDIPYGYGKYGDHHKYTNSSIYDFTSNYRRRMSSEWAPAGISRPDPPAFDIPGEIYNQHMGLLPGYSAHVPGAKFRYGRTFTDDSRDARRALLGDRF